MSLAPEEKGAENLARQIKMTGRAYPLFDIAQLVLQKPDRYTVTLSVEKNAEGKIAQPLFVCALDDTLWLSEDDAVSHVLKHHFGTFYQAERTATEPPKGKYTFVGQCGLSGEVLGPPNHHDYQNRLRKLHSERFARMPFEAFKSRVRIVRDEEVVKKWVEDQSWKTEYICLNMPEPLRLGSMEEVQKHFRETHKDTIIKSVETQTLTGTAARALRSPDLARLVRHAWEDQKRFPLRIATTLSQQFAGYGLQFFKVNKTVTHVSVARPHFLDLEATPLSEGVQNIVNFINSHPRSTRRKLVEGLAPSPAPTALAAQAAAVADAPAVEGGPAPIAPANEPTPEQTAISGDLHWLIHQGHVIEFANGILETAKRPLPKPQKAPKPAAKTESPAPAAADSAKPADTTEAAAPAAEAVVETGSADSAPAAPPAEPPAPEAAPVTPDAEAAAETPLASPETSA